MARTIHRHRRRNNGMATFMAIVFCLLVLAALVSFLFINRVIRNEVTVEAGTSSVSATEFLKRDTGKPIHFVSDVSVVNLAVPASYPVLVGYEGKQYEVTLTVKDTTAPFALAENRTTAQGVALTAQDFVTDIQDVTAVTVAFKQEPDFSTVGTQNVTLVLTDIAENVTELTATLTVQ